MTFDAVLFDMDGTLVDSDSDAAVERPGRRGRASTAWTSPPRWPAHGSPADATVGRLRPDLDGSEVTAAAARRLALQYADLGGVVPTPGTLELLAALRGLDGDIRARGVHDLRRLV